MLPQCRKCGERLVVGENTTEAILAHRDTRCRPCRNVTSRDSKRRTRANAGPQATFVYVLVHPCLSQVKVGIFKGSAKQRLSAYQTGCPDRAYSFAFLREVSDYRAVERKAHKLLAHYLHSHEWFSCSVEQAVEAIQAASS